MRTKSIALLAALLAAAVLVACGEQAPVVPTDTTAEATAAPATTALPPAPLELVADGKTEFVIVRAEEAEDEETVNLLKQIRTAFEKSTGVAPALGTDWKKKTDEPNAETYEILVGATNHPESAEAMAGVKYRDYVIKRVGRKIVINAHTKINLTKAVNHFIAEVVERGEVGGKLLFAETDNFVSTASYMLDSITLGGKHIQDYTITLPADASYAAEEFVRKLHELIADRCGYSLPIAEQAADPTLTIAVTDSPTADEWGAHLNGSTLSCTAGNLFAYDVLYTTLSDTIRAAKGTLELAAGWSQSGSLTDSRDAEIARALTVDGDLRILYHNIWGSEMHNRDDMQAALYLTYLPDVIGLQEVNADRVRGTKNNLFTLLADEYTEVPIKATNPAKNNYVPILYRTDKFDLIDYGWHLYDDKAGDQSKAVSWAVFRDKTSGKAFGMANTHFYWTSDELGKAARLIDAAELVEVVDEAQKKHNVPFIIGGDLNCRFSADPQNILRKADWLPANPKATVYKSNTNGHHAYPTLDPITRRYENAPAPTGNYSTAIDHIYAAGTGVEVRVFNTLLHPFAIDSSDHCPIYVDIKLD